MTVSPTGLVTRGGDTFVEHARDAAQHVIDAVPEMDDEGEPGAGPEHQPERAGAAGTAQHVGADRGNEQAIETKIALIVR